MSSFDAYKCEACGCRLTLTSNIITGHDIKCKVGSKLG